jgi:hypothetical protein
MDALLFPTFFARVGDLAPAVNCRAPVKVPLCTRAFPGRTAKYMENLPFGAARRVRLNYPAIMFTPLVKGRDFC